MTLPARFYTLNSSARRGAGAVVVAPRRGSEQEQIGSTDDARRRGAVAVLQHAADMAVCFVMLALLGGCAGTGGGLSSGATAEQKQKAVAERAEARWAALIKGDLDAAYTYLSPTTRSTLTLAQFKARIKPGLWREAKAQAVKCDADACAVEMQITYDMPKMKGIKTPLQESWIIENGTAWYVFR